MMRRLTASAALLAASVAPALAHPGHDGHGSLLAGIAHPLSGMDHLLAMVAVGLWAALVGGRALWQVPAAFVAAMLAGFGLAHAGVGLPFVEPLIAASVMALGLLTFAALKVPAAIGMAVAGFFALFHGHAHGAEFGEAGALPFVAGVTMATAMLHAAGVGAGLAIGSGRVRWLTRVAGAATALGGLWIAAGV